MKQNHHRMAEYFSHYRFNSLFFHNLFMLLILTMVPVIAVGLLGFNMLLRAQDDELNATCERIATGISARYHAIIDRTYAELIYFSINSDVGLFMLDSSFDQQYYRPSFIENLLQMPVILEDHVRSVFIYSKSSGMVISSSGVSYLSSFKDSESAQICLNHLPGEKTALANYKVQNKLRRCISVFADIYSGANVCGIAVANLDRAALIKELDIPENVDCCLVRNDTVWLSTEPERQDCFFSQTDWQNTHDSKIYTYTTHDDKLDMDICLRLDTSEYQSGMTSRRVYLITYIATTTWLTLMFAFFISFRLFQPMEKILESVRTMNLTEEEKGALLLGKNELETILTSIQKSGSSLRALDKELKNRIYALKKAQTIALQAQINPHFLNNTLETMNWMALTQLGRKNEISEMATDLSNLLRIALDQSETMIPIRTEIEYCKCYLGIQLKRYEDRFDVIWEIDSQILDCKIIKMVLQPLVENAIYHGIKPMAGKGKITISCCLKDNSVLLSVSDNGIGMTEQSLWALRNMLAKDSIPADDHIGLANVNQRLRLFFGSDCGLEIESTPQDRTTVHFRIPIS